MMKVVALIAVAAVLFGSCSAGGPARPVNSVYPDAKSVRLFVMQWTTPTTPNDTPRPRWLNPAGGYQLSPAQAARLRRALLNSPPPTGPVAGCFEPHHFFRFYNRSGRQLGEVAVCFCCGGVEAKPALSVGFGRELRVNFPEVESLVKQLGASVNVGCDL
jgi:hypothetical protein